MLLMRKIRRKPPMPMANEGLLGPPLIYQFSEYFLDRALPELRYLAMLGDANGLDVVRRRTRSISAPKSQFVISQNARQNEILVTIIPVLLSVDFLFKQVLSTKVGSKLKSSRSADLLSTKSLFLKSSCEICAQARTFSKIISSHLLTHELTWKLVNLKLAPPKLELT
jgi:hypothetical protein